MITATSYSKAVLRVAVEEICAALPDCCYFPSYEVITGIHAGRDYFADNLRDVSQSGVDHAMGLFSKHFMDEDLGQTRGRNPRNSLVDMTAGATGADIGELDTICEEMLHDPDAQIGSRRSG